MSDKLEILETFENEFQDRDYVIEHTAPEFTSLCPKTGQPDFANMNLEYIPDEKCIELKSLKLYYNSYRNEGVFYESLTNKILDDLVEKCAPRWMKLTADFNVRGGIGSRVTVEHISDDFIDVENFDLDDEF
ncbi:MAG: NADPH-dependent 7-cyano-7-deazaguanine reductase [Melioribacteraceae bacterium]|nr:MAG: NADPH-dependent 7-cyano-7-deazaguanine reductase [Melioribacteraceae bacterium]